MNGATKRAWNTRDMLYVALAVALMAVCAWICVPAAVPFTLQTFGVFITAGLLGKRRGLAAVLVYLLLGIVGMPVFSGFRGGVGVLLGNTGGYLIGFVFTALIVGAGVQHRGKGILWLCLWMALGLIACYLFGTLWFYLGYAQGTGEGGLLSVLAVYVFPFLIPDGFKIALSAFLITRLQGKIRGL